MFHWRGIWRSLHWNKNVSVSLHRGKCPSLSFSRSQALVQHLHVGAVQAADVAAPVERAVAALRDPLRPGPVPSPAAQQLAAVQGGGGAVAGAAGRAHCARLAAVGAEVGRLLKVDQVVRRRGLMGRVLGLQVVQLHPGRPVAAFVAVDDPRSPVKAVLEEVPHGPERRQTHPTGLDGAGARHPVALALLAHLREDGLKGNRRKGGDTC